MMRVLTEDGDHFSGVNAAALVQQLHANSFAQADSDAEYMEQWAARSKLKSGNTVRHDSAEHFIADLVKLGELKLED